MFIQRRVTTLKEDPFFCPFNWLHLPPPALLSRVPEYTVLSIFDPQPTMKVTNKRKYGEGTRKKE
jgi:hypothetical protein